MVGRASCPGDAGGGTLAPEVQEYNDFMELHGPTGAPTGPASEALQAPQQSFLVQRLASCTCTLGGKQPAPYCCSACTPLPVAVSTSTILTRLPAHLLRAPPKRLATCGPRSQAVPADGNPFLRHPLLPAPPQATDPLRTTNLCPWFTFNGTLLLSLLTPPPALSLPLPGGWDLEDHEEFLAILRSCEGDYTHAVAIVMERAIGFSRQEVIAHARWHMDLCDLELRKRVALERWRQRRVEQRAALRTAEAALGSDTADQVGGQGRAGSGSGVRWRGEEGALWGWRGQGVRGTRTRTGCGMPMERCRLAWCRGHVWSMPGEARTVTVLVAVVQAQREWQRDQRSKEQERVLIEAKKAMAAQWRAEQEARKREVAEQARRQEEARREAERAERERRQAAIKARVQEAKRKKVRQRALTCAKKRWSEAARSPAAVLCPCAAVAYHALGVGAHCQRMLPCCRLCAQEQQQRDAQRRAAAEAAMRAALSVPTPQQLQRLAERNAATFSRRLSLVATKEAAKHERERVQQSLLEKVGCGVVWWLMGSWAGCCLGVSLGCGGAEAWLHELCTP